MDIKDELIDKLEEYSKFLSDEISKTASYLWIHGWRTTDEVINLGIKLRDEIQELKDKLNKD